jgi:hypothetical protein
MSGSMISTGKRMPAGAALALVLCLAPLRLPAYVISATLEYSVDEIASFYLNGHAVALNTPDHYPDYAVLSTTDGTLPLKYFNPNGDNLLAVSDFVRRGGGDIAISYRLTVHHSNGDPVVVWSVPQGTKLLHLSAGQPQPAGWTMPGFDDSTWPQAVKMVYGTAWYTYPEIPDPAFGGAFGFQGVVPHLSFSSSGAANSGDVDLFRNHFSFPYSASKTRIYINPPAASQGQAVAVRILPGRDAADVGAFSMYADLPKGLQLVSAPKASSFDRQSNRVAWSYPGAEASVRYIPLGADRVIDAGGWTNPEKVLGGFKPTYHPTGWYHKGIPEDLYQDGATFYPGSEGIFGLSQPDPAVVAAYPEILGVIFHGQMMAGGQNTATVKDVDDFMFNYSVTPDGTKVLKHGVWVSRVSNANAWFDGYYDASTDIPWTWADVQNLRVYMEAETRRNPDKNRVASMWAVVRCYRPQDMAPVFYARVADTNCEILHVNAGLYSRKFGTASSDGVDLPVNQGICPTPTAIPTVSVYFAAQPVASPTPGPGLKSGSEILGLGCLASAPEPFNYAGVFMQFCLKKPAQIKVRIFDSSNNLVREFDGGNFGAGDGQIFFNAQDASQKPLLPGPYTYQLNASNGEVSVERNGSFTRASDKGQ